MRAIVIDDEKPSLELLKRRIAHNGALELVGAYTDPVEALAEIPKILPDVVFADVEMPAVNGMELARRLRNLYANGQIVFVTAYEKYAVEAFQVHAVNYILKPITDQALSDTVNRLLEGCGGKRPFAAPAHRRRICALGELAVYGETENRLIRWPTSQARELFSCFILNRKEIMDKWTLCERIWPKSTPKKAEQNLHSAVNMIRNALGEEGVPNCLFCEKGRYRMDLSAFSCDVWEFQAFLEENPVAVDATIARYEQAMALYRGDLFGTEDYAWSLGAREKLNAFYVAGLKKTGGYFEERKEYGRAEEYLLKAGQTDPYDEETAAQLLRLYFATGRKGKMTECYDRLKSAMSEGLGLSPKAEVSRLYSSLLRKL